MQQAVEPKIFNTNAYQQQDCKESGRSKRRPAVCCTMTKLFELLGAQRLKCRSWQHPWYSSYTECCNDNLTLPQKHSWWP